MWRVDALLTCRAVGELKLMDRARKLVQIVHYDPGHRARGHMTIGEFFRLPSDQLVSHERHDQSDRTVEVDLVFQR